MSYSKIIAICAGCAISAATASAAPDYTGQWSGYNDLLLTPAPHKGNTVDSPRRAENNRLWTGRAIGDHQTIHAPGAASYGAPASEEGALIYVRVNHTAVAISPWEKINNGGLQYLEQARNLWLKENGYVLNVRTFVNPRFLQDDESTASAASNAAPSATIRRHAIPAGPSKMQVMRPVTGQPVALISKPGKATVAPATEIAKADETAGD
jgi:hypothetical protein